MINNVGLEYEGSSGSRSDSADRGPIVTALAGVLMSP